MQHRSGAPEEALTPIRSKRYPEKYLGQGRDVILIGAAFDPDTRNLGRWIVEEA